MRWVLFVPLSFIAAQPIQAEFSKCEGDNGVTHYYANIMPPECYGKTTIEMSDYGVVIRKNEITVEKRSDELQALQAAAEQKRREEERRDNVLLNTYTSEEEIDWAIERNVHPIELNIIGIEIRLAIARTQLQSHQQQVNEAERNGSLSLSGIKEDMALVARGVTNLERELSENKARIKDVHIKFEADRKRFLELMMLKNTIE